ncbi:biosynthetic-type acetolactate synthase large subunit [Methanoculleus sp. Wushi-C6]|uniref:Acetolactate synthase n=1 Tax=Methanoculleus caldifontis TaxID=2651577 RepID=A0ABU3X3X6_9EURY|nr:biosynthetic-type acetolactate synthase large subunit [Methanoculleus sp. Wushi-C6]MDV2482764.1 biosynthetic-type acetolactate synthase large subunit [Methanoculleus sp. Wushi-C6]
MKTGAGILLDGLAEQGVTTIFGYPGAAVLPIYDELPYSGIRHILVRHEQAAAHAADGYARASGRTGVCLATSGPGACNLVTGIATAYMDSVPMVALTGQVPTTSLGNDAFQEADITGITAPITKRNYLVRRTEDLAGIVREAFSISRTGRCGPVLVDLPRDVLANRIEHDGTPPPPAVRKGRRPADRRQIEKAVAALAAAERPVIYAGGGVVASGAAAEVVALAEALLVPVTTTLMGLGLIPGDHPLNLGMPGMHGTRYANAAITECDLLFAVGVRFDDRVTGQPGTFAPGAAVVHIDVDPAEIGKIRPADIPIVGDAKAVLAEILGRIRKNGSHDAWISRISRLKTAHPLRCPIEAGLYPQRIVRDLCSLLGGAGIIATEVGQNQMWTAQHYCFRHPRSWISSGGLGTMGYGLPAAMGAHFARPDETVCLVAGDGSLQMNIQELGTIAQYAVPLKILVLNNCYLGMVRQWQELFYDRRYACTDLPTVDFAKIARAYGIEAETVEDGEDVKGTLSNALDHPGPYLVDFRIEREENVFPMVPPGAAINAMIDPGVG